VNSDGSDLGWGSGSKKRRKGCPCSETDRTGYQLNRGQMGTGIRKDTEDSKSLSWVSGGWSYLSLDGVSRRMSRAYLE
jgi:hypothetical protein